MKKVYCLLLLLSISKIAAAQEESPSFKAALRATPIFMFTKVDEQQTDFLVENDGVKLGFAYGIMGDFFLADNYALSAELRHALVNAGVNVTDQKAGSAGVLSEYKFHLQYVEIPLTFKMQTKEIGYMRYYGQFGIKPSVRVKAKQDAKVTDLATKVSVNADNVTVSDKVNLFGMGIIIGAGTSYNLGGTTSLLGGLSFHNGFTNLVKEKDYHAKIKPAYIALDLGVIF
jgi:hypothetical protein